MTPYFGPSVRDQTIEVSVNGVRTDEWTFTMDRDYGRWLERFVRLPRKLAPDGIERVAFRIARPRVPSLEPDMRDPRPLGIAISAVTLTDAGPPRSRSVKFAARTVVFRQGSL